MKFHGYTTTSMISNVDDIPVYEPECYITNPDQIILNNKFKDFKTVGLGQYCYGLNNYLIAKNIGNAFDKIFNEHGTVVMIWDNNTNEPNNYPLFSFKNNGEFIRFDNNVKGKSVIIYRQWMNKIRYNISYIEFIKKADIISNTYSDVKQIRRKMEEYMGNAVSVVKYNDNVKLFSHYCKPYLYQGSIVNSDKEFIAIWQNCI